MVRVKLLSLFPVLAFVFVAALGVCSAAAVFAQGHPCVEGFWTTSDGSLSSGRISEAWCGDPQQPGVPGNMLNAMSWDGAVLGAQWRVWGMAIDGSGAVETGRSIDATGFGWIDYVTNYEGGELWLAGGHTWSDGTDLTGLVTLCSVGARVTYFNFEPVAVASNISLMGHFDQCGGCTIEIVANSMRVWATGSSDPMPADFPTFLCGSGGELHDSCCLTAQISCVVGADEAAWGAIKSLYR